MVLDLPIHRAQWIMVKSISDKLYIFLKYNGNNKYGISNNVDNTIK